MFLLSAQAHTRINTNRFKWNLLHQIQKKLPWQEVRCQTTLIISLRSSLRESRAARLVSVLLPSLPIWLRVFPLSRFTGHRSMSLSTEKPATKKISQGSKSNLGGRRTLICKGWKFPQWGSRDILPTRINSSLTKSKWLLKLNQAPCEIVA